MAEEPAHPSLVVAETELTERRRADQLPDSQTESSTLQGGERRENIRTSVPERQKCHSRGGLV